MSLKRTVWNVGLTKDIDARIKNCADKRTGQIRIRHQITCEICGRSFNQFGIKSHVQFAHIKNGSPMKGRHHTQEAIEKNRQKHLGKIAWNKGLKGFREGISKTEEHILKIKQGVDAFYQPLRDIGMIKKGKYTNFYDSFKKSLRERLGNVCTFCNKTKEENGRNLDIHHKDCNKSNFSEDNFVILCRSCHRRLHIVRKEVF
jgi:hypothetical protein